MTLRNSLKLAIAGILFCSCATPRSGTDSIVIRSTPNLDLALSADWNSEYSDDSNVFIDFTIENKSTRWAHVDQVDIDFPNAEQASHNLIVGNDLQAWAESYAIRRKREDQNAQLGIAGLIIAGTVLMVAAVTGNNGNTDSGLLTAGAVSYAAGVTASASRSIRNNRNAAQRNNVVPETHLLAPMTLPSQGFAQRWLLINTPQKRVAKNIRIRIHTVEGDEGVYEIPLLNTRTVRK